VYQERICTRKYLRDILRSASIFRVDDMKGWFELVMTERTGQIRQR